MFLRKEIVYHLKREPEAGEATRKLLQWSRRWTVRAFTEVMAIGVKRWEQMRKEVKKAELGMVCKAPLGPMYGKAWCEWRCCKIKSNV